MTVSVKWAVGIVSLYLLIYVIFLQIESLQNIAILLFVFSPFFLVWMVLTILKKGRFDGKELKGNEEYGYGDRPKK